MLDTEPHSMECALGAAHLFGLPWTLGKALLTTECAPAGNIVACWRIAAKGIPCTGQDSAQRPPRQHEYTHHGKRA